MVVSVSPSNLGLALEHLHFVEQPSSYYYDTYQPSQMLMAVPEERRSFGFAAPVEFKAALTAETPEFVPAIWTATLREYRKFVPSKIRAKCGRGVDRMTMMFAARFVNSLRDEACGNRGG